MSSSSAELDRVEFAKDSARLWSAGFLSWLLYPHQAEMYDAFQRSTARKFVYHCSRRLGKSANLLTLANEMGLRKRGAIIRYGAAQQKDVQEIVHPLMRILTRTCPEEIKPVWKQAHGKYIYPKTGAELIVSGLDEGRADNLRGASMDLGIIDEAGFVDDLDYVIKSILVPQLLTTNGRMILSSTSPRSAGHAFVPLIEEAKELNAYIKKTIHQDSRPDILARIPEWQKESGGEKSTTWRREYLCEIITDEDSALIPEFTDEKMKAIIRDWPIPEYCQRYTVADLGLIDFTAVVFGYVDFLKGRNVIQDELLIKHKTSEEIKKQLRAKEIELWGENVIPRRFVDGPALTVYDLNMMHKLDLTQVDQHDPLDAQVNSLRLEVQTESLIISPKCRELIRQLKYGVWDKRHAKFDRNSTYGHFDMVAAAMYFVRHTNKRENPFPSHYGLNQYDQFRADVRGGLSPDEEKAIETIFNLNRPEF